MRQTASKRCPVMTGNWPRERPVHITEHHSAELNAARDEGDVAGLLSRAKMCDCRQTPKLL